MQNPLMNSKFLWGVAISAYQSEGGYNGAGQPQTNWALAEIENRVSPVGNAAGFWNHYDHDFKTCRRLGLNAFRMSIEWSRVQPSLSACIGPEPEFDNAAIIKYAEILNCCFDNGLEPIVTLHHFVHPAWLGQDPWLSPKTSELYLKYVKKIIVDINHYLLQNGKSPLRFFLTINEPNMLVVNTYLAAQFPSSVMGGIQTAIDAINNLLITHIQTYNLIHDIYEDNDWGNVSVSFNNYTSDIYWLDKAFFDLLLMKERKVNISDCLQVLFQKSKEFYRTMALHCRPRIGAINRLIGSVVKTLSYQILKRKLSELTLFPSLAILYGSPRDSVLDYIAMDYYDPFSANTLKIPRLSELEIHRFTLLDLIARNLISRWWDWRVFPEGLRFFCEYYSLEYSTKPVLIAENGMAHRREIDNRYLHRKDGMLRSKFLELHIKEILDMLKRGIPIIGYMHWSLFDNYEWGSYAARFGLFSLDYSIGVNRLSRDHYGDCPSETYAQIIKNLY
jgi:6-phospho-beta-galactosidase